MVDVEGNPKVEDLKRKAEMTNGGTLSRGCEFRQTGFRGIFEISFE